VTVSTVETYGRAVLGLLPRSRPDTPPGTELKLHRVGADRDHLAEYDRVCGFRLSDTLPPTYPHVLAFPLALRLMSRSDFPFPVVGLVHVANRIEVLRPIDAGELLDLTVRAADLRPHERGRQLDVVAEATVEGEPVWRDVSTYLHKEKGSGGTGRDERQAPPTASAVWRVPARTGGEYAAVSGDHNPIHTSTVGAKLFGFPRRIAHGMWSMARCLAALEGRLPDWYTVDASFKRPVLLPGTVAFSATGAGSDWQFGLHDPRSGAPHLLGRVAGCRSPHSPPGGSRAGSPAG
jgi:MaoC like domain